MTKATRTVPGRPVSGIDATASTICDLISGTLATSPHLDSTRIDVELSSARDTLGLLAAGGHLRCGELVLVAAGLRMRIDVPVGDDALGATAHTEPPRGAATADDWTLHVPSPPSLSSIVDDVTARCPHLSSDPAPDEAPKRTARSTAGSVDLSRISDAIRGAG